MAVNRKEKEDGAMLRKAIADYNEDDNQENLTRIIKLLRDSKVWVPCETVLSEADQEKFHRFVNDPNGFDAVIGKTFHFNDPLAFYPDEVTDGENNYIPVYSRQEEAGECREGFSLHQFHFLDCNLTCRIGKPL